MMTTGRILDRLADDGARVVQVDLSEDRKHLKLLEQCDCSFNAKLNKEQAQQLLQELSDLVAKMEPGGEPDALDWVNGRVDDARPATSAKLAQAPDAAPGTPQPPFPAP